MQIILYFKPFDVWTSCCRKVTFDSCFFTLSAIALPLMKTKNMWQIESAIRRQNLGLFRYRCDLATNPRNDYKLEVSVLEGPDAAQVVGVNAAAEMLFVQQYRFGIGQTTLELPGGLIDEGETPAAAARRELREETGYTAKHWQALGKIPSNPVFMENYVHHFYAAGIELTEKVAFDPGEDIQWRLLPVAQVKEKLLNGEFLHPHTVAALLAYFAHTSKLTI